MLGASSSAVDAYAVLLCEGDQSGHEAFILGRWADRAFLPNRRVKVFPCGTGDALLGMSDAYGRKNRVLVLEDRDFRSEADAQSDCRTQEKDRRKRGVRLIAWKTLHRNEIENYLLEPACLLPVLTDVFGCSTAEVDAAMDEVIPSLVPFQVLQAVQYRARARWEDTDPAKSLPNNLSSKPRWAAADSLAAPDLPALRDGLDQNAKRLQEATGERVRATQVLSDFDAMYETWKAVTRSDPAWRIDWAGKEVLSHLLMLLAARFGLPGRDGAGGRERLDFKSLSRPQKDALYRTRLEAPLHPELDRSFLRMLQGLPTSHAIAEEFAALDNVIVGYQDPTT